MDRKKTLLGVVVSGAVLGGLYMIYERIMYVSTDNAQVEAHTVMLAPKVTGYVTKVNVLEGQKVKAGEVLVEIDERDFQNALRQFRGELASIEARKKDAEKNFKRVSELYAKEAVSPQQYDQNLSTVTELRSKFEAVSAQVAQAELNLENSKVKAPTDGFIARKSVDEGQLAAAGVPLIGFVGAHERWITANFKETDLHGIRPGSDVDVYVDALPGAHFKGEVTSLSAATGATFTLLPPDNATGNFTKVVQRVPVRISMKDLSDEEAESLRAGLSAYVKVRKN